MTPPPTLEELRVEADRHGLASLGVTDASVLEIARDNILERKDRGLHGGMWFTYGRPERSTDPQRILDGARSIIVAALRCHRSDPATAADSGSGKVARYVREPFYDRLRAALDEMARPIRAAGHEALVVLDDNRLVDRAVAHRAGMGWFGKNTLMLVNDRNGEPLGSWFVLGSIVTTAHYEPTGPVGPTSTSEGCGPCVRCQTACPTGALDIAGELDARKCLAWLVQADGVFPVEHRIALGGRIYGCDECQDVCPPNVRFVRRRPGDEPAATATTTVDIIEMLSTPDDELMDRFGTWYVPRRQPAYLRRNALVVLANIADGTQSAVAEALALCLESDDPIVVAHAVWAAKRLGHDDLLTVISPDVLAEPMVAVEIERSVAPSGG